MTVKVRYKNTGRETRKCFITEIEVADGYITLHRDRRIGTITSIKLPTNSYEIVGVTE